jgi:hypothetical protein
MRSSVFKTIICSALITSFIAVCGDRAAGVQEQDPVVVTGLLVMPVTPVAVAPGQPEAGSEEAATPNAQGIRVASPTAGIINALCSVTLNIVGCGFFPDEITLSCDSDSDGTPDLVIPLSDITLVNRLLVRATIPATTQLPGAAFPLGCCGGIATLTLTRHIGLLTQTLSTEIDLGLRAPVVLSVTPSAVDCGSLQNLLISGSCFLLADETPNVTSVFAVDRSNPANVVQALRFSILSGNLIDADFNFGAGNAGKSFLFFVDGPSGRSRNLTSLPPGAFAGCPLGNEAGIQVMMTCSSPPTGLGSTAIVTGCSLIRTESGSFVLTLTGANIHRDAVVTVGGGRPKKVRFRDPDLGSNTFRVLELKGRICKLLPGAIVITNPGTEPSVPYHCGSAGSGCQ